MSYVSALRKNDQILVWERTEQGRELKYFPAPYYFFVEDEDGDHTSIFGSKVTRYDFDRYDEFQQARQAARGEGLQLFESDLPSELKLLSKEY